MSATRATSPGTNANTKSTNLRQSARVPLRATSTIICCRNMPENGSSAQLHRVLPPAGRRSRPSFRAGACSPASGLEWVWEACVRRCLCARGQVFWALCPLHMEAVALQGSPGLRRSPLRLLQLLLRSTVLHWILPARSMLVRRQVTGCRRCLSDPRRARTRFRKYCLRMRQISWMEQIRLEACGIIPVRTMWARLLSIVVLGGGRTREVPT